MADLGSLLVRIEASTAQLRSELARGEQAVRASAGKVETELGRIDKAFKNLGNVANVLGVVGGVTGLVMMGKQALDAAGGIGELADQCGVSARALQELEYGAAGAGVRTEELHGALGKLTSRIGEAAGGSDEAIAAFDKLGVKILDAEGKTRATEAVLRDIAAGYQTMGDKAQAAAAIKDIFGRAGQRLVPILKDGAAGLDAMAANAHKAGAVLSDDLIANADEASDKIAAMEKSAAKFGQTLAATVAPALSKMMDLMRQGMGGGTFAEMIADQEGRVADAQDILEITRKIPNWVPGKDAGPAMERLAREKAELERLRAEAGQAVAKAEAEQAAIPAGAANPAGSAARKTAQTDAARLQSVLDDLRRAPGGLADAQADAIKRAGVSPKSAVADEIRELVRLKEARTAAAEATQMEAGFLAEHDQELEKQAAAYTKTTASIESQISSNAILIEAMGQGTEAYDKQRIALEILAQWRSAGLEIGAAEQAQAERMAETLAGQQAELGRLGQQSQEMKRLGTDVFHAIGTATEEAILKMTSLRQVMAGLLQDIAKVFLRMAITKPLEGIAGQMFSSAGASLFGTSLNKTFAIPVAGAASNNGSKLGFAAGGRPPLGVASIVGEEGPELFVPDRPGTILPADITSRLLDSGLASVRLAVPATAAGAGSGSVTVENHWHIDARGAYPESIADIKRQIAATQAAMPNVAVAAVAEAAQRGGRHAAAIRGTR